MEYKISRIKGKGNETALHPQKVRLRGSAELRLEWHGKGFGLDSKGKMEPSEVLEQRSGMVKGAVFGDLPGLRDMMIILASL